MQLDYLRYFIALNQYKSINKTGRELNTTPQNVSRILKQIESELKVDLFFRTPQGIIITNYGKDFLEFAKTTISQYDALQAKFNFLKNQSHNEASVTLFTHRLMDEIFLNDMLIEFSQAYPGIFINNVTTDYKDGYQKMLETTNAIGCFNDDVLHEYTKGIPDSYEKIPLFQVTPVLAVSHDHPFAKKSNISIQDLIGQKMAIYTVQGNEKDTLQYALLEAHNITNQVSYITSSSLKVCYRLAATSDYVMPVALESFQHQDLSITKDIVTVPYSDFPPAQQFLIKPKNLPADSAQQLFCTFLLDYVQKNIKNSNF